MINNCSEFKIKMDKLLYFKKLKCLISFCSYLSLLPHQDIVNVVIIEASMISTFSIKCRIKTFHVVKLIQGKPSGLKAGSKWRDKNGETTLAPAHFKCARVIPI